jgi:O-antigen/teichoic acid export membrane protein
MIGWRLSGALIGFLISTIFTLALSFFYLRKIIFFRSSALPQVSYRELIKIGIPSALTVFALNALISNDLLIMKMWFNDYQIGQYAGLSLVGRVIFYISAPITTVMFPVLMNKYTKGESYKHILYASCGLVGLASVFITTFYFVFPDFSIMFFLKRAEYLGVSSYIGVFGIFISLYSLVSLMSYYFLSIKKFVFSWVLFAGVLLQAILIFFFHNNFGQIVNSSIVTTAILLLVSIYLLKTQK